MRLAWFSPMPPVPSGIAACSAELVSELGTGHTIDVYAHTTTPASGVNVNRGSVNSAHDFVWRHRLRPYDLTIYQLGNSSHHDYIWPYLFRYPGLTVLHDAHLHHARAAALLRTQRQADFRDEFAANHPGVSRDLAELAVAGFDSQLYYEWPMTRLVISASRLTAVHSRPLMHQIQGELPEARVTAIRLAHGRLVSDDEVPRLRSSVRGKYGIAEHAIVFGVFGGLTPDKRLPQILNAFEAISPYAPSAQLLLAGAPPRHYDAGADVARRGLESRVTITGYLADESDFTACIAACDVSLNLRWPTAREMSGPWLRALAAGRPTITVDLAHMVDVPALDPRTWKMNHAANREPVTVAIDILDEDHSLRVAMRRLATDPALRASLGDAGRRYWEREHSMPRMVDDYERVMAEAAASPIPHVTLPSHLVNDGDRVLNDTLAQFSLRSVWE